MISQKLSRGSASLPHGPACCSPEHFAPWDQHQAQKSVRTALGGVSVKWCIPGAAWLDPSPSCLPCSTTSWAYQAPLMMLFLGFWQEGELLSCSPFQFWWFFPFPCLLSYAHVPPSFDDPLLLKTEGDLPRVTFKGPGAGSFNCQIFHTGC